MTTDVGDDGSCPFTDGDGWLELNSETKGRWTQTSRVLQIDDVGCLVRTITAFLMPETFPVITTTESFVPGVFLHVVRKKDGTPTGQRVLVGIGKRDNV